MNKWYHFAMVDADSVSLTAGVYDDEGTLDDTAALQ